MMFHRIAVTGEVAIALVASIVGLVGLGFAVFGPATFSYGTNWLTAASISVWDHGIDGNVAIFLVTMVLAALAISVGAYLRSRTGGGRALAVLWTGVVILAAGALLTLPGSTTAVVPSELHASTPDSVGIGIYLFPAVLAALIAAIVGTAVHHGPSRAMALRPH